MQNKLKPITAVFILFMASTFCRASEFNADKMAELQHFFLPSSFFNCEKHSSSIAQQTAASLIFLNNLYRKQLADFLSNGGNTDILRGAPDRDKAFAYFSGDPERDEAEVLRYFQKLYADFSSHREDTRYRALSFSGDKEITSFLIGVKAQGILLERKKLKVAISLATIGTLLGTAVGIYTQNYDKGGGIVVASLALSVIKFFGALNHPVPSVYAYANHFLVHGRLPYSQAKLLFTSMPLYTGGRVDVLFQNVLNEPTLVIFYRPE